MKKVCVLILACFLTLSFSAFTLAADFRGKVKEVDGKMVTIQITKGKTEDISVGDKVKLETKGAPKKGGSSMLQGC